MDKYDAGYLSDFGGGDVDWWQDYLRAELERSHNFYSERFDQQAILLEKVKSMLNEVLSEIEGDENW